jgi:hypothetical protein
MSFAAFLQVLGDVVARYAATRPCCHDVGDRSRVEPRILGDLGRPGRPDGGSLWLHRGLGRHSPTFALEVLKAHIGGLNLKE